MVGRRAILETFRFLQAEGYRLAVNFKVKKKSDCYFFERVGTELLPDSEIVFVSFIESGQIAIIGDPLKAETASSISALIQQVVICTWPNGLTVETAGTDFDVLNLANGPWMCSFDSYESALSRLLVARIIEQMLVRGWRVSDKV